MTLPDFNGAFMPSMIPAAPGTYIVELGDSGSVLRTPIVAWAPDAENPYRAPHPITVDGITRLTSGRAVEFPDGMIHDRNHPVVFTNEAEWMIVAEKGERTADPKAAPKVAPAAKPKTEPSGDAELKIEWATGPFKTNSFYRYTEGDVDFIFQVDGGLNPPKQKAPVKKIKRDEFMALKKTVDVADYNELLEGRAPGMDDIGSFENEDEDDDLMGGASDYEDEDGLI